MATIAVEEKNCKGQLIEFCLKNKKSDPKFEISDRIGPAHDPIFVCKVLIDGTLVAEAKDKNKKSAENKAAKLALQVLGKEDITPQLNYVALLNEFSQAKKRRFRFILVSRDGPPHNPEFTMRVEMDDKVFPTSSAKGNKKQAQKEAAYLALQELAKEFPKDIPELPEVFIDESGSQTSSLSGSAGGDLSGNRSFSENGLSDSASTTSECQYHQDPVALLSSFCQKHKRLLDFEHSERIGPSHKPQMSCKAKIGTRYFPESNMRKSKKQAKKEAAVLALKELKSEFPLDIPDLTKLFIDDSETGHSLASSHVNTDHIKPPSESRPHSSETPNSELTPQPSGLTPSNIQRQNLNNGLNQPTATSSGGVYFLSSSARSSSNDLSRAQSPLAQFDNIDRLDKGGFGQVFKARKILDDKFYAVKKVRVLDNKVLQEVTALASLEHQNIVRYYNAWLGLDDFCDISESSNSNSSDLSKTGTCLYIQMELCENGSLKKWIRKRNSQNNINKPESLEIFRQIIEGVRYIHSQQLIHRDLKPGNILFTKNMIVKIGDFGLVTRMTGEEEKTALERTRGTGTRHYMAPEQKDNNKYENEVDIYPLGLILYELLWILQTDHEKLKHFTDVRQDIYPDGFKVQHPMEKIEISKMLSHDPKKRPLAKDLATSLKKITIRDSQTH